MKFRKFDLSALVWPLRSVRLMISPRSGVPLHMQVAAELRRRIVAGTYPAGAKLPAASRLAYEFDTGLGTVRRALAMLAREGLVASGIGLGTWVREPQPRDEIVVPSGALLVGRPPTPAERAELDLDDDAFIVEVHSAGRVKVYPTDRYQFRTRG